MLEKKTIIVAVSSSIAAYKACEIVSRLRKFGAEIWVVMTKEATKLVTPLTFRTLSGNPVITDLFSDDLSKIPVPHISLAQRADLFLIAPCTANIIGKLAHGIADDPLTTMAISSKAIKLIAPAMNGEMWSNPVVAENVKKLEKLGCRVIGPVEGKLACGVEDIGCMSEPEEIVGKAIELLGVRQDLKGRHILITAGGTEEAIDLVRCISNRSSGKMGYALAGKARERGAKVTLISANVNLPSPLDIKPIRVQSTREMLDAVLENYKQADAVVMAAAVADFRPKESARRKIKKNTEHKIELEETEDILMTLAKQKGRDGKIHVGFALETENLIKNAKLKMKNKGLDLIVVNSPSTFGSDSIACSIVDRKGKIEKYNRQKKTEAANMILDKVKELMA